MFRLGLLILSLMGNATANESCSEVLSKLSGPYKISAQILESYKIPFTPKDVLSQGPYIGVSLPFIPVGELFKQITKRENILIKNRGEAHVTIINPFEVSRLIKANITISELNELAMKANIQSAPFSIDCLGKVSKLIEDKLEHAYFLVVKSEAYFTFRREVYALLISRGGDKSIFNPDLFFPHITVGYTLRDLHYSDGAIKDSTACHESLLFVPADLR